MAHPLSTLSCMNASVTEPAQGLPHPQLLAQPDGRLAGLLWRWPGATATTDWNDTALPDLARQVTCLALASETPTDPQAQALLAQAGLRVVPDDTVLHSERLPAVGTLPPGVQWVVGPWYLQPHPATPPAQAASRQRALALLQLVTADADTHDIEDVFRQDAHLSYQLLRLVNSVAFGARREVASFRQAILMLGRQQLKRWLNLLLFTAREGDERGTLLMAHVSLRARGMELMAQAAGMDKTVQDQAFMAGMFSMLGVLFGRPLADLLHPLQLTEDLRAGLLDRTGVIGQLLTTWEALESTDPQRTGPAWAALHIPSHEGQRLVTDACAWTFQLTQGPGSHGAGA